MNRLWLNLAAEGFINRRPARRLATLLWLLAVAALAGNVYLYWNYYVGSGESGLRLAAADQRLADARTEIAHLKTKIAGMDLARQNATVAYLNRKISERTFSWSALLDRVAQLLPDQVRVTALGQEKGKADEEKKPLEAPKVVRLRLTGEAKSDEGLLAFVDALYESPSFSEPNLVRERQNENGYVLFEVTVTYLPSAAGAAPAAAAPVAAVAAAAEPAGGEK